MQAGMQRLRGLPLTGRIARWALWIVHLSAKGLTRQRTLETPNRRLADMFLSSRRNHPAADE